MTKELEKYQEIERTIIKRYRKELWSKFILAVKKYDLIQEGDKIAVCISGGKDSMLLAKLMQILQRYSEIKFDLVYLVMNPGYSEKNVSQILKNAEILNVPITLFESNIFSVANETQKNPCYLCARMRRGCLYAKAQELGCNKIALGHHKSDVIETTLMGMFYGAQIQGMLPRIKSTNFNNMELIRPLYCIFERDINKWKEYNNLEFIECACKFTEENYRDYDKTSSARYKIKKLIEKLRIDNPDIEDNIFESMHNVQLDTFIEYKKDGLRYSFLDKFKN